MIPTDTRGSLDERNPTFFGRFPQKHTLVFLSILTCCGMMGVPLNSPCFWILYYKWIIIEFEIFNELA